VNIDRYKSEFITPRKTGERPMSVVLHRILAVKSWGIKTFHTLLLTNTILSFILYHAKYIHNT